jgi:TonB family protein
MKTLRFLLAVSLFAVFSFAQDVKKDDWFRVQSDNGEFSIEVPAKYGYFYDKEGLSISNLNNFAQVSRVHILNAYVEHTLLSFERYKAGNVKTQVFRNKYNLDNYKKTRSQIVSEITEDENANYIKGQNLLTNWKTIYKKGYKIRQSISKNDKQYTVRQYFYSKNFIYVLTASSRESKTGTMRRFFNSLVFNPKVKTKRKKYVKRFSALEQTKLEISEDIEIPNPDIQPKTVTAAKQTGSNAKSFLIISQPRASYTDDARLNNENGAVRLKITISESGQITKIVVRKALKYGLVHNSILTAMRIKALPPEKDDKPVSVTKTIEYRFTLY